MMHPLKDQRGDAEFDGHAKYDVTPVILPSKDIHWGIMRGYLTPWCNPSLGCLKLQRLPSICLPLM